MALSHFEYSKSWRDPEDFPSYEENEEQVRDDMQRLFDEIAEGLNTLVTELAAANLPFSPTPEIDAADVQNAIELLQSQLEGVVLGQLPNGSVITDTLAELAVTSAKLAAGAVTSAKLGTGAVTSTKLGTGAVTSAKLSSGAVTEAKLADGAVTAAKIADGVLAAKADLDSGRVRASQLIRPKTSVSSSRALALSDAGRELYCSNSSVITLTIPANSDTAFPIGTELQIFRKGSGRVNIAAAEGVTLYCPGQSAAILSRYAGVRLRKWDSNVWSLEGEGLAPAGYLANFSAGFAPDGAIRLTEGVHYFSSEQQLPAPGVPGRIFLVAE